MVCLGLDRDAATALFAMEEVLSAPLPAETAFLAVELTFGQIVVEKVANLAKIVTELGPTLSALVANTLDVVAGFASDLLDGVSVDLMLDLLVLLEVMFDFVVTEPAGKELLALVTLDFTATVIVGAFHLHLLFF
mmetsp:Transcript_8186/g.7607  ORF Transcript_8186/g.7607 Transcript_8186/m.7607 type:complete len:135 (-) Transcript_8186:39-443(-)